MKNIILFSLGLFCCLALAIDLNGKEKLKSEDLSAANVNQVESIYIFILSKPAIKYNTLGSVKLPAVVLSKTPKAMFETLVKKCKKEYPRANGLIFDNINLESAQAIEIN